MCLLPLMMLADPLQLFSQHRVVTVWVRLRGQDWISREGCRVKSLTVTGMVTVLTDLCTHSLLITHHSNLPTPSLESIWLK